MVLWTDGGIGADVTDHAASDLAGPRLSRAAKQEKQQDQSSHGFSQWIHLFIPFFLYLFPFASTFSKEKEAKANLAERRYQWLRPVLGKTPPINNEHCIITLLLPGLCLFVRYVVCVCVCKSGVHHQQNLILKWWYMCIHPLFFKFWFFPWMRKVIYMIYGYICGF
jgi:hypothetical protein